MPIVPMVSIGAQETQFFLARGTALANRLGLPRFRAEIAPLSIGVPFGKDPDVDEIDDQVRRVMQRALNRLARQRRFPILG